MPEMSAEEFLKKIQDTISGKDTLFFDAKSIADVQKQVELFTKNLKKAQPGIQQWSDLLDGTKKPVTDMVNNVQEQLDKLNKAIKQSTNTEEIASLEAQKQELKKAAVSKTAIQGMGNLAISVASLSQSVYEGARDFVKGLQSGASGVELATQASIKAARVSGEAGKAVGEFGKVVGFAVSLMGGPWTKAIGLAIAAISEFTGWFSSKAADKAADAAELLGKELEKTQKGFKDITSAGALFGGGMTQMRQEAARAGLDIQSLSEAVRLGREDFINMGLGLGESIRRIGGISRELRNTDLGMQLRKLGFGIEEQAALIAQVMANQNAAGNKRAMSDAELAKVTAQYGQDLRVLADITGQDAKKAMEKARLEAMQADVLAEAMRVGGPEAVLKLQQQLAAMPEGLKKGYMEFVSSQGQVVTDVATNVAMNMNPKIREQYLQQYTTLQDRNKRESDALAETGRLSESTAKYARENNDAYREIGQAARLGGDSTAKTLVDLQNSLILDETRRKEGATDAAKRAAAEAARNAKPLDVAIHTLNDKADKFRSIISDRVIPALELYATAQVKALGTIEDLLAKYNIATGSTPRPTGTTQPNAAGGTTAVTPGGAVTSVTRNNRPIVAGSGRDRAAQLGAGDENRGPLADAIPDLVTVTSKSGKSARVGKQFGPAFQSLLDYLDSVGYNIVSLGGYNNRDVTGQPGVKSAHAFGAALDINPGQNPYGNQLITDMPENIGKIARSLGLGWGGEWPNIKDAMHFSAQDTEGGSTKLFAKGGITSGPSIAGEAGPEAVVPLPDGRTIPVRMDTGELVNKLDELLAVMKSQRDISEKTLWASS